MFDVGKVRNSLNLGNGQRIIHTTDRVSAFDSVLPFDVVGKGRILNQISWSAMVASQHIAANHLIERLSDNHLLVKNAEIIPVEWVVRRTLSGSLWKMYHEQGVAKTNQTYDLALETGLPENFYFQQPVLTPTTKGTKDIPIGFRTLLEKLPFAPSITKRHLQEIKEKCLAIFEFGEQQFGTLNLVDAKYEFGLVNNIVTLVDEIHTPDCARFIDRLSLKSYSKEYLRQELQAIGWTSATPIDPIWTDKVTKELLFRYDYVYGQMAKPKLSQPDLVSTEGSILLDNFKKFESENLLPKTILVLGSGGREFTIAQKFRKYPEVRSVVCAAGDRDWPGLTCVPTMNSDDLCMWAKHNPHSLVLVGPESYVTGGVADAGCIAPVLAPSKHVAQLESSKIFCKEVCRSAGVLTPHAVTLDLQQAYAFLKQPFTEPNVIKYDGLAAGKGVVVLQGAADKLAALALFEKNLGDWSAHNGNREPIFLLEDMVTGDEVSVTALCNGRDFKLLPHCRDYKRRNSGQEGPNTGGMGAACPVTFSSDLEAQFGDAIKRVLIHLSDSGHPYRGFLFAGFMIEPKTNVAWLLEINCRLGEPETQVLLPGLGRDFVTECLRTAKHLPFLTTQPLGHDGLKRVFVVHASPEYPEPTSTRRKIKDWVTLRSDPMLISSNVDPASMTTGGRMFGYLGVGNTFDTARRAAFDLPCVPLIDTDGIESASYVRTDIAAELI